MSDSLRLRVRDAVVARLNDTNPPGVPTATRRRWFPGEKSVLSMAVFFVEEDTKQPMGRGGPLAQRQLTVAVQCVAATTKPELLDDLIEPMLAHATRVLGSTLLDGLATAVEERSTKWETATMDKFYIAATTLWRVEFQTKRDDLTAKQ